LRIWALAVSIAVNGRRGLLVIFGLLRFATWAVAIWAGLTSKPAWVPLMLAGAFVVFGLAYATSLGRRSAAHLNAITGSNRLAIWHVHPASRLVHDTVLGLGSCFAAYGLGYGIHILGR
jgi:hypothetical protein